MLAGARGRRRSGSRSASRRLFVGGLRRRLPRRPRRDADRARGAPPRRHARRRGRARRRGGVVVAALAFVPLVGYVLVVALPLLGLRARSREPERHAGLRTLARD